MTLGQVFKLSKAANSVNGPVSFGKAFTTIIDIVKTELTALEKEAKSDVSET